MRCQARIWPEKVARGQGGIDGMEGAGGEPRDADKSVGNAPNKRRELDKEQQLLIDLGGGDGVVATISGGDRA